MPTLFAATRGGRLGQFLVLAALLSTLMFPTVASANPSIGYVCDDGGTLSGDTCYYDEPTEACPAGFDPFPSTGGPIEKCYAPSIGFDACPPGGTPDPSTMHSDGTFKGCLAEVISITSYPARRTKLCNGREVDVDLTLGQSPSRYNDVIWGTNGPDVIYGGGGNDIICGRGGDDAIYGGRGKDQIFGNDGSDELFGNKGYDRLFGGAGFDSLFGNEGRDRLFGGGGDDHLDGGPGNDKCAGGPGNNNIVAGTCG